MLNALIVESISFSTGLTIISKVCFLCQNRSIRIYQRQYFSHPTYFFKTSTNQPLSNDFRLAKKKWDQLCNTSKRSRILRFLLVIRYHSFLLKLDYQKKNIIKSSSNPLNFAEQFFIDCTVYYNYRCLGGAPYYALDTGIKRSMPYEARFPYKQYYGDFGASQNICNYTGSTVTRVKLNSSTTSIFVKYYVNNVTKASIQQIKSVLKIRPIIISINGDVLQKYKPTSLSGRTLNCSQTISNNFNLYKNHAVLLVGYTKTQWIIKNSWGYSYGYNNTGYVYVNVSQMSNCGIWYDYYTLNCS